MSHRTKLGILTVVLVIAVAALVWYAGFGAPRPSRVQSTITPPSRYVAANSGKVVQMSPAEKRSMIASSFPIEVPVAAGRVTFGEAQGESAWDYEVVVAADARDVESFYRSIYAAKEWALAGEKKLDDGAVRLTLRKGEAQSEVTVAPVGEGRTKVLGVVGVGTDILLTQ